MMTTTQRAERKAERAAHVNRMNALRAEAQKIVNTGVCPTCGGKLKRNLSLAGWWQCEQLGAVNFRKDASKLSCDFQTFTE